eukprot:m.375684 g.375684  ORF g.375684 m.375684 type:complete len:56 (+) comp16700_c0_seq5:5083-5250(+)
MRFENDVHTIKAKHLNPPKSLTHHDLHAVSREHRSRVLVAVQLIPERISIRRSAA